MLIAGKSTVGALLERFYEPEEGTILLDGRDIGALDTKWLRGSCLGYIGQVVTGNLIILAMIFVNLNST